MTGPFTPPAAVRGVEEPTSRTPGAAVRGASPMSGSEEAAATQAPVARGSSATMLAASGATLLVLLALWGLAAPSAMWRVAQNPALGVAMLQLCTLVVCLCGHLSPSSKSGARRKYGGLLLLAVVAGSALPSADAVSAPIGTPADDLLGEISTWAEQSRSESSPPAQDNQTDRAPGVSAEGLLPRGTLPEASILRERAASRKLLQWPAGMSDADRSPGPDPEFLHKEKRLKDMSKQMEAGLER
jgi:hypothetical protein